jgi:hypothetical protein
VKFGGVLESYSAGRGWVAECQHEFATMKNQPEKQSGR